MARRKQYLLISLSCFALAVAILYLFSGCTPRYVANRQAAEIYNHRSFNDLYIPSDLHKIITLPPLTIHIVGRHELFDWEPAQDVRNGVFGYADSLRWAIWLLGVRTNVGVIVNQNVLGHECKHFLHRYDNAVANPHNYDKIREVLSDGDSGYRGDGE